MNRVLAFLALGSLSTGCAAGDPSPGGGEEAGSTQSPFLAYYELGPVHVPFPGATTHGDITEQALAFMDDDVAEDLGEYNEDTDTGDTKEDSAYHNDNCQLERSFASVRSRYDEAVAYVGAGDYDGAARVFGTILHTTQDFYAHSDWIEAGQTSVYTAQYRFEFPSIRPGDPLGSPLGSMVFLALGGPNWSVRLPAHTRVPKVTTDSGVVDGLITGTYDNGDGNCCLASTRIPHGDVVHLAFDKDDDIGTYMTKDVPGLPFRDEALEQAHWQTAHEFCRLGRMVSLRRGVAAHDALISEWKVDRDYYVSLCGDPRQTTEAVSAAYMW